MPTIYRPTWLFENGRFEKGRAVVEDGGRILAVLSYEEAVRKYPGALTADWSGLVLVPGTVNAHNHSFQSLLRGIAADRPFLEWRDNALYKFSPRFRPADIYTGAVFAFAEMMKCGVTTVCDFFYLHNFGTESDEMIIKAARDVGIRLTLARTMYDWQGAPRGYIESVESAVRNTKSLYEKYRDDGMVSILPAPHSLHAATPEMVQAGAELAARLGTKFHIHVAEEPFEGRETVEKYGKTPVELLDHLGVVNENMVIIHGVWLKDSEVELLGSRGAGLAYCPSSNMFLSDGVTDIPGMMRAGVTIGLGSDGACSNNRISVFEEMRMVSLLQKAHTLDALCLNYEDAFRMGTENGGKLLGLPVGRLEPGFRADFTGIRLDDFSMQPVSGTGEQLLPNVVYSMQPTAVAKVVVDGLLTVDAGRLTRMDETGILSMVRDTMRHLQQ